MAIRARVIGAAGRDNALHVEVDSGSGVQRLLFDCGEGCLAMLEPWEVQALGPVFFSHYHMDHIAGFDGFFRTVFDRADEGGANRLWGPPGTGEIFHHRFRGYLWNLHESLKSSWRISEIGEVGVRTWRLELHEAFATAHEEAMQAREGRLVWAGGGFTVESMALDHRTVSLGYRVTERDRRNVDPSRLSALGAVPGRWLSDVKDEAGVPDWQVVEGRTAGEWRDLLLTTVPGDSVAYLTDFRMDAATHERLAEWLKGCGEIFCESQYRAEDRELAERHHHLISTQAAALARDAGAGALTLFHVSARYDQASRRGLLDEARAVFPAARFPVAWGE